LNAGESFTPELKENKVNTLSLQIFNSNGLLIFEASGENPSWDGALPDGSLPETNASFPWLLKIIDSNGNELHSDSGTITITP